MSGTPETVSMSNGTGDSGSEHIRAERVEISQGGANLIEATTVSVEQGGAARVRAEQMSINQGGVFLARTGSLRLEQASSGFAVVADQAHLQEGSSVLVLFARSVTGDVRPMIDWRSAAALGLGLGLALRVLRRR